MGTLGRVGTVRTLGWYDLSPSLTSLKLFAWFLCIVSVEGGDGFLIENEGTYVDGGGFAVEVIGEESGGSFESGDINLGRSRRVEVEADSVRFDLTEVNFGLGVDFAIGECPGELEIFKRAVLRELVVKKFFPFEAHFFIVSLGRSRF